MNNQPLEPVNNAVYVVDYSYLGPHGRVSNREIAHCAMYDGEPEWMLLGWDYHVPNGGHRNEDEQFIPLARIHINPVITVELPKGLL